MDKSNTEGEQQRPLEGFVLTGASLREMSHEDMDAVVAQLVKTAETSRSLRFRAIELEDRVHEALERCDHLAGERDRLVGKLTEADQRAQQTLVRMADLEMRADRGDAAVRILEVLAEQNVNEEVATVLKRAMSDLDANFPSPTPARLNPPDFGGSTTPKRSADILAFPHRPMAPDPGDPPVED